MDSDDLYNIMRDLYDSGKCHNCDFDDLCTSVARLMEGDGSCDWYYLCDLIVKAYKNEAS